MGTRGNPDGKPALIVHGGPGSGLEGSTGRSFDRDRYRVVLLDQRGCGRSVPHASDPAADMSVNTTAHLLADMERLRESLGIERWLLYGGSWGSTLILAYAERHPERVSEIVIANVTTCRRSEIDWLYRGVGRFFPRSGSSFARAGVPEPEREGDLVAAYARLMEDANAEVRAKAAADWLAWEDAVISQEPHGTPHAYSSRPPDAQLAFVRICAHYYTHAAWLEEGVLLRDANRLRGDPRRADPRPARRRLSTRHCMGAGPSLARRGTHVIADSGHTGSRTMTNVTRDALERFAAR